jgi:hypothetical protein
MKFASLILALALSFTAYAADDNSEGQSTIKIDEVSGQKNKVDGNIDDEITNAKLRAESGSKSKWSGSFTGTYEGGSLKDPMSKDRPNPTNDPVSPKVRMLGDIGIRYRANKNDSFKLSTGYTLQRPFQEAKRGSVSDPTVTWNRAGKLGTLQNVMDIAVVGITNSDDTEVGKLGQLYLSDTVMYDFGGSKMSLGFAGEIYYNYYTKKNETVQPKGMSADRSIAYQEPFQLGAYPLIEYSVSDMIQVRTVFRPWIFSKLATEDSWTFSRRPWTQSFGVGIAATRDIYLYPNFQWDVERWRREGYSWAGKRTRETSTVGLTAVVNVF